MTRFLKFRRRKNQIAKKPVPSGRMGIDLINLGKSYSENEKLMKITNEVLKQGSPKEDLLLSTVVAADSFEKLKIIKNIICLLELLGDLLNPSEIQVIFSQPETISKNYRFEFFCEKSSLPENLNISTCNWC